MHHLAATATPQHAADMLPPSPPALCPPQYSSELEEERHRHEAAATTIARLEATIDKLMKDAAERQVGLLGLELRRCTGPACLSGGVPTCLAG
jgi:hypothetical protein